MCSRKIFVSTFKSAACFFCGASFFWGLTRLETPAQPARFAQFTELGCVVDSARVVVFLRVEVALVQLGGRACAGSRGFVGTREGT